MKKYICLICVALLAVSKLLAVAATVQSPDGQVTASFEVMSDALFYSVSKNGVPLIASSKIELFAGAKMSVTGHSATQNDSTWQPVWGQFSEIRDHHNELTIDLKADATPVTLLCRVFNDGLGFRFVLSDQSKGQQIAFYSECDVIDGAQYYWGERGNTTTDLSTVKRLTPPFVSERTDSQVLAFLESDLFSAAGFESMKVFLNKAGKVTGKSSAVSEGAGHVTTWRVILLGESTGALMVNNVVLNLAAPCQIDDTSWIQPGKGLWDWRVHGYDNGDFVYDINTKSYLRYIDFCSEQGFEYFTLDDHWFLSAHDGEMKVSPEVDIEKVMAYAKSKNVKVMLYYDQIKGDFGDETLFDHYAKLGADGMKYGFMGNDAAFTRNAIRESANNRLIINFHDGPCPMAGVERTMPNMITREFCHGQQDSRRAFTPESFLRMAVVSSLVGPLDQSNGNFGIGSINAGERKKGPRQKNSYISTVVSEVARNLVIYTGLVTLPDAPEEYLKKIDLFEFLKVMPSTWDESKVLNSKTGEYITVARRSGDTWYVASVNDQSARDLKISLDFLNPEIPYAATLYQDAAETHGVNNSESYEIHTATVSKGDVISAPMAVGGGHAMILRPIQ